SSRSSASSWASACPHTRKRSGSTWRSTARSPTSAEPSAAEDPGRLLRGPSHDLSGRQHVVHEADALAGPQRQGVDVAGDGRPRRYGLVAEDLAPIGTSRQNLALAGALTRWRPTGLDPRVDRSVA